MNLKDKTVAVKSLIQAKLYKKRTPLIVTWSITTRCDCRCKYCNIWNVTSEELETRQIFSIIEELSKLGIRRIQFTGGEALLREDIGQIIDFCKERGIDTGVNSNGSLVHKKIDVLTKLNLLCLSLDGRQATHDYLRGDGSYSSVMKAVKIARDNNIKVRFTTVLSKTNLGDVDFVLEKGREFDAPVIFQPATTHLLGSNEPNPLAPPAEDYKQIIRNLQIMKRRNKYVNNSMAGLRHLYNWPQGTEINCLKGLVACRIESNGDVYICARKREKMKPINCANKNFREAFYNLPLSFSCNSCWCAGNVEVNCLLALKMSTVLNAIKLI